MSGLDCASSESSAPSDESFAYKNNRKVMDEEAEDGIEGEESEEEPFLKQDDRSKRQRRLASIANPGANERSKGDVVSESDGSMIWWNEDGVAEDGTKGTWG